MICNNCKAEMPAEAKFCPMCGAKNEPPAPQPSADKFCTGCGLALEAGAKFCTVCGTPADSAASANNSQPVSMGYAGTVDAASAIPTPVNDTVQPVSAIPTPVNDTAKPVSAIPTPVNDTAQPVSAIPTPVNDTAQPVSAIPTPVNDTAQPVSAVPTPVNDVAQPVFNAAPSVNLDKPTGNTASAQETSSFTVPSYDYSMNSAAATAVTPIKKKNIVLPIILGAIALILVFGGIFFLINRSAVMQLFMGDSGYARMIEGNGIKTVADAAAHPTVAAGMESALSAGTAALVAENMEDSTDDSLGGININQYINTMSASLQDAYGKNGATVDIDFDLSLTDTAKTEIFGEDTTEADEMLNFINEMEITYKAAVTEDAISAYAAIYDGDGLALDAQGIIYSDGNVLMMFPFGTDKCIKYTIDGEYISTEEAPALDLDEKEFSRLANEIVDLYLTTYEQGEVTIENGEMTIGGVTAKGKVITTTLNSEQLNKLFTDATNLIANDEYFCTTIVDYINDCGGLITYDEFKEEILAAGEDIATLDEEDTLVITTIVDNSNTVLAKCYTAVDGEEDAKVAYIDGETAFALEVSENNGKVPHLIAIVEKTSETDGKANVKLYDDGEFIMTVKVDYTGVKAVEYNGNEMSVGRYEISFEMPQDFTSETEDYSSILSTATATYNLSLDEAEGEERICYNLTVSIPQYFTFAFDAVATPTNEEIPTVPADAIDITSIINNSGDELTDNDIAVCDSLTAVVKDIENKANSMSDDSLYKELLLLITESLNTGIDELKNPTADFDEIYNVITDLYEYEEKLYAIEDEYPEGYEAISDDVSTLEDKMDAIDEELYSFEVTASRLTEIKTELSAIGTTIDDLTASAKAAQEQYEAEQEAASRVDYSDMTYDELVNRAVELEERYNNAVIENFDLLSEVFGDPANELYNLYLAASDSYEDMYDVVTNMIEYVEKGDLNAQRVRDSRRAVEAFDEDLVALEKALTKTSDIAA